MTLDPATRIAMLREAAGLCDRHQMAYAAAMTLRARADEIEQRVEAVQEAAGCAGTTERSAQSSAHQMVMTPSMRAITDEVEQARAKHPIWPVNDTLLAAAIVGEESGELLRAAVQHKGEGGFS